MRKFSHKTKVSIDKIFIYYPQRTSQGARLYKVYHKKLKGNLKKKTVIYKTIECKWDEKFKHFIEKFDVFSRIINKKDLSFRKIG